MDKFKKIVLVSAMLLGALSTIVVHAQTKIKDNTVPGTSLLPKADAVLELESVARGFLPPRMTEAQRDAIAKPDSGLVVFNTTEGCLDVYGGKAWESLCGAIPVSDTLDFQNPTAGTVIFDTTLNAIAYYNGTQWILNGGGGTTNIQNLTTRQINNILHATPGELVYNTDSQSFEYYDSTTQSWVSLVAPAMTTVQINSIVEPTNGQTVYNTDEQCLNTYDSTTKAWISNCRLQATDTSNIQNPTAGTVIYDTTTNTVNYYNGTKWITAGGIQNLTTQQITNITNPSNGQLVYNTDNQSFEYFDSITNSWVSLVVPAMTSTQINSISTPTAGQTVYNITTGCLNTFNGTVWVSLCGSLPVTDTSNVQNPTAGTVIYDTTSNTINYYNGTKWITAGGIQNLTTQEITNITNPSNGQLVYNTDNQSFEYFDSATKSWVSLVTPALTTEQINNITNPANGQTVYNTDEQCLNTYDSTVKAWISNCKLLATDTSEVQNPTAGTVIYDTTTNTVAYYNGTRWIVSGGTTIQNLTTEEINNITNVTPGQLVYNTDNQSFEYYDSVTKSWVSLVTPALTTEQINNITNPSNGQTVYNTDQQCLNTYDSTAKAWISNCKLQATDTSDVQNPTAGTVIYDTTLNNIAYYNGTTWVIAGQPKFVVNGVPAANGDNPSTTPITQSFTVTDEDYLLLNINTPGLVLTLPDASSPNPPKIGRKIYFSNKGGTNMGISIGNDNSTENQLEGNYYGMIEPDLSGVLIYIGGTGAGSWDMVSGY